MKTKLSAAQHKALGLIYSNHTAWVAGIDEVGMGCWAGPVVVAGVLTRKDWDHEELKDSKKYSSREQRSDVLQRVILPAAEAVYVMGYQPKDIDEKGIEVCRVLLTEAVGKYMRSQKVNCVIVQDGNKKIPIGEDHRRVYALQKADQLVPAVAAASVLAKVTRDRIMMQMAEKYPQYGFDTNVGYHSKKHVEALEEFGVTPIHRKSYKPVQKYL